MATKTATVSQPDANDAREDGPDAPLLDTLGAELKKLVQKGKERGYVTYDELNAALPPDEVSSEQIEDTMAMLSEAGVNVVEAEESEETPAANPAEPAKNAVVAGMNGVKPKVNACYAEFKQSGMAMLNVVIGKAGKVSSATVTGKFAGTPTGSCVEKAVKSASFPPSDGLSTQYVFMLR